MRFNNRTNNPDVSNAINLAEKLLSSDSKMMQEIRLKNDFKYNSGSGEEVYTILFTPPPWPIPVYTYRPKNPFTKAVAYRDALGIHFNVYKIKNLNTVSMTGTLLHELAHDEGFNHGTGWFANRKTKEKCLYSVPYYLSENVSKWL